MPKITAYIHFANGNCREAMAFYRDCLGGQLKLQVVKDSPMADMFPPHLKDNILHASLENAELTLLGSEMPSLEPEVKGHSISLMLICDSISELHEQFNKLSAGGKTFHPIEQFYAGTMGSFIDKFGIMWGAFTNEK
ncbi:VOC family protein [Mucilaginibacter segetis]|uniref:VOC family protein n=1 Tax=Mucilaginibacter segetis TaxID=2793071 RepID=A0A934PUM5_9SPHI|nr:VOC family protein [Mucilaginibacter segetis]MBK0379902.1 VOC family protein [Mucilaginibacter segetis]